MTVRGDLRLGALFAPGVRNVPSHFVVDLLCVCLRESYRETSGDRVEIALMPRLRRSGLRP